MNKLLLIFCSFILLACNSKSHHPNFSQVPLNLKIVRFEKSFFSIDTNHIDKGLNQLNDSFPGFTKDYLFNILGTTVDSAGKDSKTFISSYQSLYDSSKLVFADMQSCYEPLLNGLKAVKYYFPKYPVPTKLVTFIGPINSYANIITTDAMAVGLQMYMGKNYSLYQTEMGQELYPAYISRRFDKAYIPINCIKNIIDDMYPNTSLGKPLIEQMIEAGKRHYLLNLLLPDMPDTLKIGYTKVQLDGCEKNEGEIWSFFVQNNLLYETNPDQTKDYINDAPNTPALGDAAPGMIGQYVGLKIVQKWMQKNSTTSPELLMQIPSKKIFEEAHYQPK